MGLAHARPISQHCWIALIFSQNVLYDVLRWYFKFDHYSWLSIRVMNQWILSISHRECTRGEAPLQYILYGKWTDLMVRNYLWNTTSYTLRHHLRTSYSTFWEKIWAIQHCWLISEQEVTGSDIRRKMVCSFQISCRLNLVGYHPWLNWQYKQQLEKKSQLAHKHREKSNVVRKDTRLSPVLWYCRGQSLGTRRCTPCSSVNLE